MTGDCSSSSNWNYCESSASLLGHYDNGAAMSMDVFVGGTCEATKGSGTSCQDILDRGVAAGNGRYTIAGLDTECEFDGSIGWTQVIDVQKENRQHCTDLANFQKFSDTDINAIVGTCGALKAVQSSPNTHTRYFRKSDPSEKWDFNGGGTGDERINGGASDATHTGNQCSTSWPSTSWSSATGHPNHYGFSTHSMTGDCSSSSNWNYCENSAGLLGHYDNGAAGSMIVWATSVCH
jgi:hypothetical protein